MISIAGTQYSCAIFSTLGGILIFAYYLMTNKDDQSLAQLLIRGDERAFECIFKKYYPALCASSYHYLGDHEDAEEMVQTVFVRIWEKRSTLPSDISIKHYLFRAVRNHCLNHLQHEKIKSRHAEQVLKNSGDDDVYSDSVIEPDWGAKIDEAISLLPPKRLEIFRLSREEGLKYKEIAEQMNISVKTVEAQMGLALKFLREKLKDFRQGISILFCIFKEKNNCH